MDEETITTAAIDKATALTTGVDPAGTRRRGPLSTPVKTLFMTLLALLLIGLGVFFGGFLNYANEVARMEAPDPVRADGIVVLTGGAERVSAAIDLLSAGHAKRLLISGVHPETSARAIGRVVDAEPSIFDCCVDLDRRAANTIGNATEAAKWAGRNKFTSLIIVTSAYHMPRSLVELRHAMPGIDLIAYPVAPDNLDLDRWWENSQTIQLLLQEYVKYVVTCTRLLVTDGGGDSSALASMAR